MRTRILEIFRLALVTLFALALSQRAEAILFYNSSPISIPASGTSGAAYDYPSTINASGLTGTIIDVDVTLNGLSHTFPSDIDILLVGPFGQTVILMSDIGASHDITDVYLTFDDSAASAVPHPFIVSGTFQTRNNGTSDTFPSTAPAGPYGSLLSTFNGTAPNGTWRLFVVDDSNADVGSMAGWSLDIETYSGGSGGPTSVPEPASLILLGAGMIGLATWGKRITR